MFAANPNLLGSYGVSALRQILLLKFGRAQEQEHTCADMQHARCLLRARADSSSAAVVWLVHNLLVRVAPYPPNQRFRKGGWHCVFPVEPQSPNGKNIHLHNNWGGKRGSIRRFASFSLALQCLGVSRYPDARKNSTKSVIVTPLFVCPIC